MKYNTSGICISVKRNVILLGVFNGCHSIQYCAWSVAVHVLWTCEIQYSTPTDTTMRTRAMSVLLCLLLSLVEVHSLTFPYLTFMGNIIPNHSYVDLNTVGNDNTNAVQCHTDLLTCCSGGDGPDRGDWFFPNEDRLPFSGDVYEGRGDRLVVVQYTGSGGTSGTYRCDIETVAVNNNDGRETVYVGLYTSGGEWSVLYVI